MASLTLAAPRGTSRSIASASRQGRVACRAEGQAPAAVARTGRGEIGIDRRPRVVGSYILWQSNLVAVENTSFHR